VRGCEVDTYSYPIDNDRELAERLAPVVGLPPAEVHAFVREALEDPELGERLTRDIGWRVLFHKRRPPLAGHHPSADS